MNNANFVTIPAGQQATTGDNAVFLANGNIVPLPNVPQNQQLTGTPPNPPAITIPGVGVDVHQQQPQHLGQTLAQTQQPVQVLQVNPQTGAVVLLDAQPVLNVPQQQPYASPLQQKPQPPTAVAPVPTVQWNGSQPSSPSVQVGQHIVPANHPNLVALSAPAGPAGPAPMYFPPGTMAMPQPPGLALPYQSFPSAALKQQKKRGSRGGQTTARRQTRSNEPPTPTTNPTHTQLMVNSIPQCVDEDEIRAMFTEFGELDRITLIRDRSKRHLAHRGFGFVGFKAKESAEAAIEKLNGIDLHGSVIRVAFAEREI